MSPQGQRVVNFEGARHVFPGDATDEEVRQALGGGTPPVPGMRGMPLPGMPTPSAPPPDNGAIGHVNDFKNAVVGNLKSAPASLAHQVFGQPNDLVPLIPGTAPSTTDKGGVVTRGVGSGWESPEDAQSSGDQKTRELPMAGPIVDAAKRGRWGEAGGELANLAIAGVGPKVQSSVGGKLREVIPSTERAGKNFETVMGKAGDQPINVSKVEPIVERARELSTSGATAPKLFTDYWNETVKPEPWTYRRGRDFASNAGRLSVNEGLSTNPQMHRQVGAFANAMNDANAEAAQNAGVGSEYNSAMTEYRRAKQLEAFGGEVKKYGKYAIPASAAGYVGKRLIDSTEKK